MKSRGTRICLAVSLSVLMVISMMPMFSFAAGSAGSVDNDRYRIVAKDGHNSRFSLAEVLIGQPCDDDPYEVATPGFAYVGDTYRYALNVDGTEQTTGVTWTLTENNGVVSYSSDALNQSILEFTCLKAGNVTIVANYEGQTVRKAYITVGNDVASGECGDHVTWKINKDRTLVISGQGDMYDFEKGKAPWAERINGILNVRVEQGVTHLGAWSFRGMKNAVSFELPSSLTSIGDGAFSQCKSVQSLSIPDGVNRIGEVAFGYCRSLTSINLPSGINALGDRVFKGCGVLRSLTIPDNVRIIGAEAFRNCTSLKVISMSDNVTEIGEEAFRNCDSLTNFELPAGLEVVSPFLFRNCDGLKQVIMHDGITAIEEGAFYDCSKLWKVTLPSTLTAIGEDAFRSCEGLIAVEFPSKVESIGKRAFQECTSLSSIIIPASVKSLDNGVFEGCASLGSIDLSDSGLSTISRGAFEMCTALTTIKLPDTLTKIDYAAFYGCELLKDIDIPSTVRTIRDSAFYNCKSLKRIDLPDGMTEIEYYTFSGAGLSEVVIPESVNTIDSYAFYNCKSLHYLKIPAGVREIYYRAIGYIGRTEIDKSFVIEGVKNSVAEEYARDNGIQFVESGTAPIAIGDCTITAIPDQAYTGNPVIPAVHIQDTNGRMLVQGTDFTVSCTNNVDPGNASAEITGDGTRYTGSTTTTFKIVAGKTDIASCTVNKIADQEYTGEAVEPKVVVKDKTSSELTEGTDYTLSYKNNIKSGDSAMVIITGAGSYVGEKTVTFTINLPYIAKGFCGKDGKENIEWVISNDGILTLSGSGEMENYENASPPWMEYSSSIKQIIIGEEITTAGACAFNRLGRVTAISIGPDVTDIGHHAFCYCERLTSVTIPSSVKTIYANAFASCYNLTSVTIPSSVKTIYANAFAGCENLEELTLNEGLEAIGVNAFVGCSNLEQIDIPASVNMIGGGAFAETGITEFSWPGNIDTIRDGTFRNCKKLKTIDLPDGLKAIGYEAFCGCTGLGNVEIPQSVTTVETYMFAGCTGLESIEIPQKIVSIGSYAFYDCTSLKTVTLNEGLETIGWYAFQGCTSLTTVNIPTSTTQIGYSAFYGCESLKKVELPVSTQIGNNALGYHHNTLSGDEEVIPGFVIYGYQGSPAEEYAVANNIPFNQLCTHDFKDLSTLDHFEAVDAHCETTGNVEYYKCNKTCQKLFVYDGNNWNEVRTEDVVVPAPGHDWDYSQKIDGKYKCKNCDATTEAEPDPQYKAEYGPLNSVPTSLSGKTLDGIKNELKAAITQQDGFATAVPTYLDAVVKVSNDAGNSWSDASSEAIPAEGATMLIQYSDIDGLPANISTAELLKYDFAAAQMDALAPEAGEITSVKCVKAENGVKVTLKSSGPLAIGFKVTPKFKLSGSIKGYAGSEPVMVTAYAQGGSEKPVTVAAENRKYSFAGLEAGTYTIETSQSGCLAKSYTLEIAADTTQDIEVYHIGDANMDGVVTADDTTVIARHIAKIEECEDAFALALFDTDQSHSVSANDVTHLARFLARIIDVL